MMKKLFLPMLMLFSLLVGAVPTTVQAASASPVDSSADSDLSQNINNLLDKKGYSGSLIVVKNGEVVFQTSRGYANYSDGIYNDPNTAFEIDSVQKSMTAAMIMKEVQKKRLKLTDKLSKFYPQIPGSKKITIRQMLDMTSGLILKGNVGPDKVMSDSDILDDDINNIKFSKLFYDKWNYSPINYNLLSGVLEQVTGKSYRKLFEKNFVKKLKLKHTIFAYEDNPGIQKAVGYSNLDPLSARLDYRNAFYTKRFFEFDELGTGQIYMSAYDLYKVEKYIMTGSILTEKSRKKLFVPGSISTYGGGMYHAQNDNFANGWGYGFQTVMHISDDGETGVFALQNYQRLAADIKPTAKQIYQMVTNEDD